MCFGANNMGENAIFVEGSSEFFLTHEPEGESHDFSSISYVVRTGMSGRSGLDFSVENIQWAHKIRKNFTFSRNSSKSPH